MKTGVIIVAGGSGNRMGAQVPKQFLLLDGRPILVRTVEKFAQALPLAPIVVVLPETETQRWSEICDEYKLMVEHTVCSGGANRFESVRAGLAELSRLSELAKLSGFSERTDTGLVKAGFSELPGLSEFSGFSGVDFVAVHDGVRCLLSVDMIRRTVGVAERFGTAIPVVAAVDSFRRVVGGGTGSKPVDRSELRAVQTPQIFAYDILKDAYKQQYTAAFTDDASVVEHMGVEVTLCDGEQCNIKITTPLDMVIAESILENDYGKQI